MDRRGTQMNSPWTQLDTLVLYSIELCSQKEDSILKSNKEHRKSPIDFIFNNKVLNIYMVVMVVAVDTFASCLELIVKWKETGVESEKTINEKF